MSFFYSMREACYWWGWGGGVNGVRVRGGFDLFRSIYGQIPEAALNSAPCMPMIPIGPSAAKLAIYLRNGDTLTVDVPPCDKQFPWKKFLPGPAFVGLTLAGELYLLSDASVMDVGGGLRRRRAVKERFNDRYDIEPPQRIFFPDAAVAFKDASGYRNYSNYGVPDDVLPTGAARSYLSVGLTAISKDGRVFVAGTCQLGEHGVSPNADKPGCTLVSTSLGTQFWQSTTAPYFPVATEVALPGGVKASSVPSGSSGSVIGEDGQLYAWWHDPLTGETQYPKRVTGFVKSINVTNPGSQFVRLAHLADNAVLPGQDLNDLRMFSRLDFSEPPPGGKKPIAAIAFDLSTRRIAADVVLLSPGMGYQEPPQVFIRGVEEWSGPPPEFECELFGDDDGFIDTPENGSGWMIGTDGCVYQYETPFILTLVPAKVEAGIRDFARAVPLAPRRVTRPGRRFKHASGNCFVDEDGAAFFACAPYADDEVSTQQAPIENIGVYEEIDILDVSVRFETTDTLFATAYTARTGAQWKLHKIGDGYRRAACSLPADSGSWRPPPYVDVALHVIQQGMAFVGIKDDGSLWTAGNNMYGDLAQSADLSLSRKTPSPACAGEVWLSLAHSPINYVGGLAGANRSLFNYNLGHRIVAIRKDAVCREIDQPMEYYPDEYYKTLQ